MSRIVELICRREPGRTATARKANSYKSASPGREITLIFVHCAAHKHTHTPSSCSSPQLNTHTNISFFFLPILCVSVCVLYSCMFFPLHRCGFALVPAEVCGSASGIVSVTWHASFFTLYFWRIEGVLLGRSLGQQWKYFLPVSP